MFNKALNEKTLKDWVADYIETRQPLESMNVVFMLSDLINLIEYIGEANSSGRYENINALRFYLVRQNEVSGRRKLKNGHTQISLACVPVENYKNGEGTDHKNGDNYVCIYPYPGDSGGEHTGLCPQNCGGSLNEDDNDA